MNDEQLTKLQKVLAQSNIPIEYMYIFSCGLCELAETPTEVLEDRYGARFDQQLQYLQRIEKINGLD